jgi:hypothetical protein
MTYSISIEKIRLIVDRIPFGAGVPRVSDVGDAVRGHPCLPSRLLHLRASLLSSAHEFCLRILAGKVKIKLRQI